MSVKNQPEFSQPMLQESFDDDIDLLEAIKLGAIAKVREKMQGISNIDSIKGLTNELPVKGGTAKNNDLKYNTKLWNPLLFAIYFKQPDIVKLLLTEYSTNFLIGLKLPPMDDTSEYIMPHSTFLTLVKKDLVVNRKIGEHQTQDLLGFPQTSSYYPSLPSVQCFGLDLALSNSDMQTFFFLWDICPHNPPWEISHLSYLVTKAPNPQILQSILSSKTAHALFTSLNPQDKATFL